jgi:hypothetical protein
VLVVDFFVTRQIEDDHEHERHMTLNTSWGRVEI